MIKYAQILIETGEVVCIVDVQSPVAYSEDQVENGILYKRLSSDINPHTFPKLNYWRNDQWNTRESKPSEHHYWTDFAWVRSLDSFWSGVRYQRDMLLIQSDWTQLADNVIESDLQTSWRNYRQALRDITTTYSSAESDDDITWPTKPF